MSSNKLFIKQWGKRLEIEVLDEEEGLPLLAPMDGKMNRTIKESLTRTIQYKLMIGKKTLFDFISDCASYEYSAIEHLQSIDT